MSKIAVLFAALTMLFALSMAQTVSIDGDLHWGARPTFKFALDFVAGKSYKIDFTSTTSVNSLNWVDSDAASLDRFSARSTTLCYNDAGKLVADLSFNLSLIASSATIQVYENASAINCQVRISQPNVDLMGEFKFDGYQALTFKSIGGVEFTGAAVQINPNNWKSDSKPTFKISYKSDESKETFRSGYIILEVKGLPKDTAIPLTPSLSFLSLADSIGDAYKASFTSQAFRSLWELFTQQQAFVCTNSARLTTGSSTALELVTGNSDTVECRIPISKALWTGLSFYASLAQSFSKDDEGSFSLTLGYFGSTENANVGKIASSQLVMSVLQRTNWNIVSVGAKVGKFQIKSVSSGENPFEGGKGVATSMHLPKDWQKKIPSGYQLDLQSTPELASPSLILKDSIKVDENGDMDVSYNGVKLAMKHFTVSKDLPYSFSWPDRGAINLLQMALQGGSSSLPKPATIQYSWGGKDRSIDYHPPMQVDTSSLKFAYDAQVLTATFDVEPYSSVFLSFAEGDVPVKATFTIIMASDVRKEGFKCTTNDSKVTIATKSDSRFAFDRFELSGISQQAGFTVTCTAPINTAASPRVGGWNTVNIGVAMQAAGVIGSGSYSFGQTFVFPSFAIGSLTNYDAYKAALAAPLPTGTASIKVTIRGPEINSQADFEKLIKDTIDLINARLSADDAKLTADSFRFSVDTDIIWSSISAAVSIAKDAHKELYKKGSKIVLLIDPAVFAATGDPRTRISGYYANDDQSLFISVESTSQAFLADIVARYFTVDSTAQNISAMELQANDNNLAIALSIGAVPAGSACSNSNQCNLNGSVNSGAKSASFCVEAKCVAYADLSPKDRLAAQQQVGDNSLSAFGVNAYDLGLLGSSANAVSMVFVALIALVAFIF